MYLGAISSAYMSLPLKDAAQRLHGLGLTHIELPAGGYFPKNHCDPGKLLADDRALADLQQTLADTQLTVSALAIHGQPLSPDPAIAEGYDRDYREACALAAKLGVTRLTLIGGIPAGGPDDKTPNWVVYQFPTVFQEMYKWQWDERLVPYWREHVKIADDHGVRLCFEMVNADMLYKPAALLRLRDTLGPTVGCNFDPSHLFWLGVDIVEVVRVMGNAIYHAHAKDTATDMHNVRVNGILDEKDFSDIANRAWEFRTVGFGHDELFWREYLSALRLVGYDDVVSIEHEDLTMDPDEGFELAAKLLNRNLLRKPAAS